MLVHKHGKKIWYLERKIQILCLTIQTSSNGNGSGAICLVRRAALFLAEAGNTHRKIPKISPSMYKPFQNNISPQSW